MTPPNGPVTAWSGVDGSLRALQARLDDHFRWLQEDRNKRGGGKPVFALEHGLDGVETVGLMDAVRRALLSSAPPSLYWLPLVVYAAEIGYRYEGDEYWDTFQEETPGWSRANNHQVSRWFKVFARNYRGAEPTGRWATQFRIICWPVTHAVLPTFLQRQLAELLWHYRGALTTQLLSEPAELGAKLAARSDRMSKRFHHFAQNTQLLGQVASALITGEHESPLLLETTLDRIVQDLSKEREARLWLQDAKRSAQRLRLKGVGQSDAKGHSGTSRSRDSLQRHPHTAPPRFSLHPGSDGWRLRLEIPDLTALFSRFEELAVAIDSSRCRISGFSEAPRPRGWLRHAGLEVELGTWPGQDQPLFELERADPKWNGVLGEECRSPIDRRWVFAIGSDGIGRRVQMSGVHAGGRYVLLATDDTSWPSLEWVAPVETACVGASAAEVQVPKELSASELDALGNMDIGVRTDFIVRPVGVEPAAWDGESSAEWLIGDEPLLELTSSHPIRSIAVSVDEGQVKTLAWVESEPVRFLRLTDLSPGAHHVRFLVVTADVPLRTIEALLVVRIRDAQVRRSAGTFREPLLILTSPASPTLEELWEGRAAVEVIGPMGASAAITLRLKPCDDSERVEHRLSRSRLPVGADEWERLFAREFKRRPEVSRAYDEATACVIEVTDADLGSAVLSCERSFTPLRWGVVQGHDNLAMRLHDNLGADLRVECFDFAEPDRAVALDVPSDLVFRREEGGLFAAYGEEHAAYAILPRRIRDAIDLRASRVQPRLCRYARTPEGVASLMSLAWRWREASLPGDPFAQAARDAVTKAITTSLVSLIGGSHWSALEQKVQHQSGTTIHHLQEGLAAPGVQLPFRERVVRLAEALPDLTLAQRVGEFSLALAGPVSTSVFASSSGQRMVVSDTGKKRIAAYPALRFDVEPRWLSEYLLRMASDPGGALEWAGDESERGVQLVLTAPLLLRAARLLVLSLVVNDAENGGWSWP